MAGYRSFMTLRPLLVLATLLCACRLDPARIADHALYADDGGETATDGAVTFAVVGNTRETVPGLDRAGGGFYHGPEVTQSIISDISIAAGPAGPSFVVHMGDGVRASNAAEWARFDERTKHLLRTPGEETGLPAIPVAGDREAAGDKRYIGMEGAWPGLGAEIGYNRVATWSAMDLKTAGHTWRIMVLDSGKERLGSRWNEQRNWIKRATRGDYDGILLFMHDPVLDLGTRQDVMNAGGGPAELLEYVEEATQMLKVRAVFGAGHHTNQVLLPDGPFGAAHVGAGGGGAPAEALRRWGPADAAGRNEDVQLEAIFDLALMEALGRWNRANELPEQVMDEAKARDTFKGFTGAYDGQHFPTYGWWQVTAYGGSLDLIFHFRAPSLEFRDIYRLHFDEEKGWRPSRPDVR
jgi:hypothetical protein